MDAARSKARFDWLVELCGALAPGLAAGFAAMKLAPTLGAAASAAMTVSALGGFGMGLLVMRLVKPAEREYALADFTVASIEPADAPLLLEDVYEAIMTVPAPADQVLLLDDPLIGAESGSRVVQLFAGQSVPTPGQLKERIDRQLGGRLPEFSQAPGVPQADASGALHAALDELRRSLR